MNITPRPFDQIWTLFDTRQYIEAILDKTPRQGGRPSPLMEASQKNLQNAKLLHLKDLFENNQIQLPNDTGPLSLCWLSAWKKIQAGETLEFWDEQDALTPLNNVEFHFYGVQEDVTEEDIQAFHEKILNDMKVGNFRDTNTEKCANTGARISLMLQNWQPIIGERIFEKNSFRSKFVPIDFSILKGPQIEELILSVPSGELWCADWFRVDDFTKLVKEVENKLSLNIDINSIQGKVDKSLAFYQNFGGMHVFVGNSSPSVIQEHNVWMLANLDEEKTPFRRASNLTEKSSICTDLWWVTMVDPQVLLANLEKHWQDEPGKAQRVMDEIAQESNIIKIKVPAKDYHVYFSGHHSILEEKWNMEEWDCVPHATTYMVFSQNPLTPKLQPVSSTPSKPRMR